MSADIEKAVSILKSGGIIAYPTEAVFGFGCDPFNSKAIDRLRIIKARKVQKGFILIASQWEQVKPLVAEVPNLEDVLATWPGPHTWVFAASDKTPDWVGETIAVRVSDHPVVKALCDQFGSAIVSSSVNREGQAPLKNYAEVLEQFSSEVDFVVPGEVGDLEKPTEIRDVVSGEVFR